VMVGLGVLADRLKHELIAKLKAGPYDTLDIRSETYGYRTPNGYEERERVVVSHGQGQVHVHIQALGDNLFVGWQALLNWAQWTETSPVTTVGFGRRSIAFRELKPSWYYPNEFDLIDLNSMSGVVHSVIEREAKALLTEHTIDHEIDFEVIRGDRENALDARKAWPERSDKRQRISNVIFGWGAVQHVSAGEMQLAPVGVKPTGRSRGVANVPAVILLPLIAALGYFWIYQWNGLGLFEVEQSAGSLVTVFPPMLDLPLAVALAIGLWLYARIGIIRALLVLLLVEAADFVTSYLDFYLGQINLGNPAILPSVLASLSYLLAASIWVPRLRDGRRWLAAIVLWTAWAALTPSLAPDPPWSDVLSLGLKVFIAACFGFWLWRDEQERSRSLDPRVQRAVVSAIHKHWVLFLVEGIVLVILGVIAILVPPIATLALTTLVGWLFLISGIVGLVTTFWARHAPGFWWSLISAIIGILVGLALLASPVVGALSLTLVLIAFFIIEGVASIMYAVDHRRQLTGSWGWMLISGIIDIILAGIILAGLPETAVWALGLLVGINMLFGGGALIAMALAARTGERQSRGTALESPVIVAKSPIAFVLNLLWIIFGGLWMAIGWVFAAVIMAITIIGLPWARAAFNIALYTLLPFGRKAVSRAEYSGSHDLGTGPFGLVGNVIWLVLAGWWLALGHVITAIMLAVTAIGIPFAWVHLKLAGIALWPIGKEIVAHGPIR
jgi:uncharacterized membrane protein YccF (DUF307 family)/uncharacterized membrane protein HdeD (DUF308 family)